MVKDTSSTIKKKRKSDVLREDVDIDIYKKVSAFEETEADSRRNECEADAKLYYKLCKEIREGVVEIAKLKLAKSDAKSKDKNRSIFYNQCVNLVAVKKLNRIDKLQHNLSKNALNAERQKCDSIKLSHQNLTYEYNHLVAETNKCFAFKSSDEYIDLVPLDVFMQNAPKSVTSKFQNFKDATSSSAEKHNLRLARLEFELQQRKNIAKLSKSLMEDKKILAEEIAERKKRLDLIQPLILTLLEATKPLQDHLEIRPDQIRVEHKLAHLLPDYLYNFYANCVSYKSVHDINMNVTINGDQDEATQWTETQVKLQDEEDSDPEMESQEEVVEVVKKRRHRKSMQVDPLEEKKKKLLESHPLNVEVTIKIKEGPAITLTLRYMTKLQIITVTSEVQLSEKLSGNSAREFMHGENIVSELVEGDFGTESPNPSTPYQLKKVGFGSFESLVSRIGHAYNWAQSVSGLSFIKKEATATTYERNNVEFLIKTICKRLVARTELAVQLQDLEQNVIPKLPPSVQVMTNAISSLIKWTSISYQTFCESEATAQLIENKLVHAADMFYSATFVRANAKLEALVAIKNSYPNPPPVFSLCLNYNGVYHSMNSDEIRDIERCLNTDWIEVASTSTWLLAAQMQQLSSYFDVLLETSDPDNFPQNAMFLKNHSGRNRRRPFKFRKVGTGIFTQY